MAYKKNLQRILAGLNPKARQFFLNILVLHDGTITRFETGDRIWNASGEGRRGDSNRRKVAVRMFVLSASFEMIYTLEYKQVTRVDLNFPGKLELFPAGTFPNFGDWGYDELTLVGKGIYRHEILFASGATVSVEFRDFNFSQRAAERSKRKRP